jgi:calcium-dependent protein kinase
MNGSVFSAKIKGGTARKFAVKKFKVRRLRKQDLQHLRNEAEIFLTMDHPNIARLVGVYESDSEVSFVMECMEGGELFDRLVKKRRFSEEEAASTTLQMLRAVNYLHERGVVHRDLKLENFLYEKKDSSAIKLIDFGLSGFWDKSSSPLSDRVGTVSYAAPEVFDGIGYTSQCDLWSLGVIVFILLSGYQPFADASSSDRRRGKYEWKPEKWEGLGLALDFVQKLLEVDPEERLRAAQALEHPWLAGARGRSSSESVASKSIPRALINASMEPLHTRLVYGLMSWFVAPSEDESIREAFWTLDRNGTGVIDRTDFIATLITKYGMTEPESCTAFDALDVNGNCKLEYSEFLAAMLISSELKVNDYMLNKAFACFDVDQNGFITQDELNAVVGDTDKSHKVMKELDQNSDDHISYSEFVNATAPKTKPKTKPEVWCLSYLSLLT